MKINEIVFTRFDPKTEPRIGAVRTRFTGRAYRVEQLIDGPIEGVHWKMIEEFDLEDKELARILTKGE